MLIIQYNRAARKELLDSSFYYSEQVPGLGERFLKEVELSVRQIASAPNQYPLYFENVRRCVMPQFPYGIYYRVDGDKIRILAIAHSGRHPDYWKHRR